MREAELENFGSGLTPVTQGWFVVNVRDAEWWNADTRGARCAFENEYGDPPVEFAQLGINLTVLEPGQTVLYHAEATEEAFLVLSGECALLVENEERRLRPWDFFHSAPWTEHAFVGAGDGPCVILMAGARSGPGVRYPVSEVAARYGASVAEETSDWRQAYATVERFRRERPPSWARLPWAHGRRSPEEEQRMNDTPKWQVARLEDIERRGRDIPVREHLGIRAFGLNAFTPGEDGTLIGEHDEAGSGQEELYIVLDGTATFELDGETVEAPAGTFVFARPESRRKATGDGTVLVVGGTPGAAYEALDWGDAWPFHRDSMTAYREQRYADALEAVRRGLAHTPDHPGLLYNYACFATLAGDTGDETFGNLRRSVELHPSFREQARLDDDLAAVRDDPRFEEALR